MDLKKRTMRIFTAEDLALQKKLGNCWITRKGRVYDVTKFVQDHPGGDDLITQFSGMDIGDAMENADEHLHSASAYAVLDEYLIGKLGTEALIVSDGQCSILGR
jgi:4-hydroxysphinganine ceramide fatty acyl 2-hydroxylase